MNAKFELEVLSQDSNEVVEAFKTEGGAQQLFNRIADQARSIVPDLSTDKSRKEIASIARKVASTKTAFDAHGKALKEQYTVITDKIDADRKLFRDQCDALRDEVRKPLTDWEDAKKARVAKHEQSIADIKYFVLPENLNVDAEVLSSNIRFLEKINIDSSFEDYEQEAKLAKFETLETLRTALVAREKYEAEQAELERLRLVEQARIQAERDAQIARDATEKANREAEEKARFEAEKNQREKAESEQREARLKAEKEAVELREQALKQKAIDDAKQADIDKQKAIEAERLRIEIEQVAKAQAEIDANAAREADEKHRKNICEMALADLTLIPGLNKELARSVLEAIYRNKIANVSIKF